MYNWMDAQLWNEAIEKFKREHQHDTQGERK
jgi:hypothetical protein